MRKWSLIPDEEFDRDDLEEICPMGEEEVCVVDWGARNYCCKYLAGVFIGGEFYSVDSEEFQDCMFNEEAKVEWVCAKENT